MTSDYKEAMKMIVQDYALEQGWVFEHDPESVDVYIALVNMSEMENRDELPEMRPAYRVAMHSFGKLFALA
jgi:hypothetical protein